LRPAPEAVLCVWALAADTEADAWHYFSGRERLRIDRNRGVLGPLPSPEEVASRPYTASEQVEADHLRSTALVGSGPQVAAKLRALADTLGVQELVIITWTHDSAVQRRSYELLAREFV
jgi:alkanesulfonate monooxygenase SsuD/methylene tetrahydromethanopterin reductase-like flavin-dependent oxidoreductase (luciferase family)